MVTMTRPDLADLEELLAFLLERRITRVHLNPFRAIGRGAACADWAVTPQEVRAALDRIRERIFPGQPPSGALQSECMNCGIGSFLNILPEIDVFPCHVLATPAFRLGNATEQSLWEMCAADGPLGRLQSLDFRQLVPDGPGWEPLVKPRHLPGNRVPAGTRPRDERPRAAIAPQVNPSSPGKNVFDRVVHMERPVSEVSRSIRVTGRAARSGRRPHIDCPGRAEYGGSIEM